MDRKKRVTIIVAFHFIKRRLKTRYIRIFDIISEVNIYNEKKQNCSWLFDISGDRRNIESLNIKRRNIERCMKTRF